jgi:hypothetical protein
MLITGWLQTWPTGRAQKISKGQMEARHFELDFAANGAFHYAQRL